MTHKKRTHKPTRNTDRHNKETQSNRLLH